MQEIKIELSEDLNNTLLDKCKANEIADFYDFLEQVIEKSVYWYCNDDLGRKEVKLSLMGKMKVQMRYEFTPYRKRL